MGLTEEGLEASARWKRILECKKLGFNTCVIPKANLRGLDRIRDIQMIAVDTVAEALNAVPVELYNLFESKRGGNGKDAKCTNLCDSTKVL